MTKSGWALTLSVLLHLNLLVFTLIGLSQNDAGLPQDSRIKVRWNEDFNASGRTGTLAPSEAASFLTQPQTGPQTAAFSWTPSASAALNPLQGAVPPKTSRIALAGVSVHPGQTDSPALDDLLLPETGDSTDPPQASSLVEWSGEKLSRIKSFPPLKARPKTDLRKNISIHVTFLVSGAGGPAETIDLEATGDPEFDAELAAYCRNLLFSPTLSGLQEQLSMELNFRTGRPE